METSMEYRTLGRTGLKVSALAFGCGDVGGIMVSCAHEDRERAVARAVELGINYLDTAPSYGSGQSERNTGAVLRALRPDVIVGSKCRLSPADLADVPGALTRSVETSLSLLGIPRLDLFHLHNPMARIRSERRLGLADVLDAVAPAARRLQEQGKIRFFGVTALGETGALHRALASGAIDTAQVCLNLLNPTAAHPVPSGFRPGLRPARGARAREHGVGTIGIPRARGRSAHRAGQASHRHSAVDPIASGPDYATDASHAASSRAAVR
jgi:L-galactose dehydrogenase/L-glyceraldehyde 3-phosphate reductase